MNRLRKILGAVVQVARWIVRADRARKEIQGDRCRACDSSRAAGCWGWNVDPADTAPWCPGRKERAAR